MHDPIAKFADWFAAAQRHEGVLDATVMTLATATNDGIPSARIVLLKDHGANGFVFYTNFDSRKGTELKLNPKAALCFYWAAMDRQVRIEGNVTPVSDAEADTYFAGREREKQIAAWASHQSEPLESREELQGRVDALTKEYDGKTVPRPPHWSGWRLTPHSLEFWHQGQFRIHEREIFTRESVGSAWQHTLLNP